MHAQKWILIESKVLKEIPEEDKTMEISLKYGGELLLPKLYECYGKHKKMYLPLKMPVLPAVNKVNIAN